MRQTYLPLAEESTFGSKIQAAKEQLTTNSGQKGDTTPNASPLPTGQWSFSQPLPQAMSDPSHRHKPLMFTGDKGQDMVSWRKTIEDYLGFVSCSEHQPIACIILLLLENAQA